jgi:hypothetical protein
MYFSSTLTLARFTSASTALACAVTPTATATPTRVDGAAAGRRQRQSRLCAERVVCGRSRSRWLGRRSRATARWTLSSATRRSSATSRTASRAATASTSRALACTSSRPVPFDQPGTRFVYKTDAYNGFPAGLLAKLSRASSTATRSRRSARPISSGRSTTSTASARTPALTPSTSTRDSVGVQLGRLCRLVPGRRHWRGLPAEQCAVRDGAVPVPGV